MIKVFIFFYFCAMNKTSHFKWVFLCLILCCACNNLTQNSSSTILPMDSVVTIMTDCYFLEGEIYVKQWTYDVKDYSSMKYSDYFEKHGLTKEIFVENIRYYFTNKKYAEEIMNKLDALVEQRVAILRDSLDLKQ